MSELLKDAAKRGLKKAARWASTGKNLPRLKGMQAWWQRHVGDQNEVNVLREQYASLIHAPDKRKLLASHERKIQLRNIVIPSSSFLTMRTKKRWTSS